LHRRKKDPVKEDASRIKQYDTIKKKHWEWLVMDMIYRMMTAHLHPV
jgi:hypothetical protein